MRLRLSPPGAFIGEDRAPCLSCSPHMYDSPLLSGGEGEPRPDSGHHNEDLGEKKHPNQLH